MNPDLGAWRSVPGLSEKRLRPEVEIDMSWHDAFDGDRWDVQLILARAIATDMEVGHAFMGHGPEELADRLIPRDNLLTRFELRELFGHSARSSFP
jgi:hypothetical protein